MYANGRTRNLEIAIIYTDRAYGERRIIPRLRAGSA